MTSFTRTLDEDLHPFVVEDFPGAFDEEVVESEGISFHYVYDISIGGVPRKAKKLHKDFVEYTSRRGERDSIVEKFKKECLILSKLRHPNVVQFIGVFYGKGGKNDVGLIMEKLNYDLFTFLEINAKVELSTKLSILHDVSYGLVYLHECNPPIIHRNLLACNVLLNGKLQAKIAGMGTAMLIDQTTLKAAKYTTAPGQLFFMPPEAKFSKPSYSHKLDIFLFGQLSLHTLIQTFPTVFEIDFSEAKKYEGFIEKRKRQAAFDRIGSDHVLYPIIVQCLRDNPELRPSTRQLNTAITNIMDKSFIEKCNSEIILKENAESKLQQSSDKWSIQKLKFEQDIASLTNQVEHLQINIENQELRMDQSQKEFDTKLQDAETMLLKEKQKHSALKEKYEINKKELEQIEAQFTEEKLKLLSQQQSLEMQFQETKCLLEETEQHFAKKMDQNTKQIQSLNLLRKEMSSQLEDEKQRIDEGLDTISKLSRDISTKNHILSQYERELQFAQDRLQKHELDGLKNYEIKEVQCIKSKVNAGSYGSISLVNVNGMLCIQKCLHDILVGLNGTGAVGEEQQRSISEKFYEECRLLWKMCHPNIVQFMGIHYNGEVGEIHKMSLIMEYLPSSAEDCITKCSKVNYSIPGSIKISVLRDVTYGLSHLHANDIIHRDLSAANILLTYSMGAKIADLGVSKLVSSLTNTKFTAAPGASYIMPPEALEENPHYSSKLDIFSLGIFILYLISQKEPVPRNATLNLEHVQNKQIEIGRRLSHIHLLRSKNPELVHVVVQTLQDGADKRPTAANLCIPINSCFQKVKHQLYHDLADFINSIGRDILVFPDC